MNLFELNIHKMSSSYSKAVSLKKNPTRKIDMFTCVRDTCSLLKLDIIYLNYSV